MFFGASLVCGYSAIKSFRSGFKNLKTITHNIILEQLPSDYYLSNVIADEIAAINSEVLQGAIEEAQVSSITGYRISATLFEKVNSKSDLLGNLVKKYGKELLQERILDTSYETFNNYINNRESLDNRYQNKIHGNDPDISLNSPKFQEIKSYDTNNEFKDAFSVPAEKLAEFLTQLELNEKYDENKVKQISTTSKSIKMLSVNQDLKGSHLYELIAKNLGLNSKNRRYSYIEIFDATREKFGWPKWDKRNVGFLVFKMEFADGSIQSGVIFAKSGFQYLPGSKINQKLIGNKPAKIIENVKSKYATLLKAEKYGIERWSDSERKLLLALVDIFKLNELRSGVLNKIEIQLASERGFCDSCDAIIKDFKAKIPILNNLPISQFYFNLLNERGPKTGGIRNNPDIYNRIFFNLLI